MQDKPSKPGKAIIGFALCCLLIAGVISVTTLLGSSGNDPKTSRGVIVESSRIFDQRFADSVNRFRQTSDAYLNSGSSERTLHEYYSRRQYRGSPPLIPHPVVNQFGVDEDCLACHGEGGFTAKWNRHAPLTPHPEMEMCRQCHIAPTSGKKFVDHDWISPAPPRLGESELPGSPPPIPHDLQMREDCVACHAGPGAVIELKMRHEPRGICRQCHVPTTDVGSFSRDLQSP